ncbi:MAG: hypothetical protein ACOH2V_06545 [Candidatus Saccharimonadaceae bacterium]
MVHQPLFWMAIILFFLSMININVYLEYKKPFRVLPIVIGVIGAFGMIVGLLRLIVLSLQFNWWWFVGIAGISLLIVGVFSYLFRNKISYIIASINILAIPFVWWYGSQLNTVISYDWFYRLLEANRSFFC